MTEQNHQEAQPAEVSHTADGRATPAAIAEVARVLRRRRLVDRRRRTEEEPEAPDARPPRRHR